MSERDIHDPIHLVPDDAVSARRTFVTWQWVAPGILGAATLIAAGVRPRLTATVLLSLGIGVYAAVVTYKARLIHRSLAGRDRPARPRLLPDERLPRYTILVPLYDEAAMVEGLATHLAALDYPADRYEVLFLCEPDDRATMAAVRSFLHLGDFRLLTAPDAPPRTKPRACDVGLAAATGKLLVIYDAEDRPEPDQLRVAASAFAESGPEVLCLQARLDYHNHRHNWLTRSFANEYNAWFDLLLPALSARELPIPLGGTSNHFRVDGLRSLGGWDPYNVTEDADLGVRLYAAGHRTGMIDSVTWEEACSRLVPWTRQRTRWMKGYLQTALVHTRSLRWLRKRRNPVRALVAFLVMVPGTPGVCLLNPVFWGLFGIHLATKSELIVSLFPTPLLYLGVVNLVVGNLLFVAVNLMAAHQRERWHLGTAAVTAPVYWALMSFAAWRATFQLLRDPHRWEKTPHGLTTSPELIIDLTDPVEATRA